MNKIFGFAELGFLNGGNGSGNFAHKGRPGVVGGSGDGSSDYSSRILSENFATERDMSDEVKKKATAAMPDIAHPELAWIMRVAQKSRQVKIEDLEKDPAFIEAKKRAAYDVDTVDMYNGNKGREELDKRLEDRLLGDENGSFVSKEAGLSGEVRKDKIADIVIGRPAGGKSSVFANPLSKEHKARIIDADTVKEWLPEFDNGYGAGKCQRESSNVAEKALKRAISKGENVVIPKIGGNSVVEIAKDLKAKGYTVNLYYNDVRESTSITRAASRFAEKGRYLDISYLNSIGDKPTKTFKNYANDKSVFDYAEWRSNDVKFKKSPVLIWKSGDDEGMLKG